MRTVFYAVLNTDTKEKFSVGCNHNKAEEKLAELQKANPKGNYKVVYKWGSI